MFTRRKVTASRSETASGPLLECVEESAGSRAPVTGTQRMDRKPTLDTTR